MHITFSFILYHDFLRKMFSVFPFVSCFQSIFGNFSYFWHTILNFFSFHLFHFSFHHQTDTISYSGWIFFRIEISSAFDVPLKRKNLTFVAFRHCTRPTNVKLITNKILEFVFESFRWPFRPAKNFIFKILIIDYCETKNINWEKKDLFR